MLTHPPRFFFMTTPMPCPFIDGHIEQRLVTDLTGPNAADDYSDLSLAGFSRSQTMAYVPVCDGCTACVSFRVPVHEFKPNKNQRLAINRNRGLIVEERAPIATTEQYALFDKYIQARHPGTSMSRMEQGDYTAMVENTTVQTKIVEFREQNGDLALCLLIDLLNDGLSFRYGFFDTDLSARRSLGKYSDLWLIERTRELGLDYMYSSYWVKGCQKLKYKLSYKPSEGFVSNTWQRLST